MVDKVKLALYDNDLKIRTLGKFEITSCGTKIRVKSGGKANFNPFFDSESYLDFPKPWYKGKGFERLYIASKTSSKCINFKTGDIGQPTLDEIDKATALIGLEKMNRPEKPLIPPIVHYVTLLVVIGILLKLLSIGF